MIRLPAIVSINRRLPAQLVFKIKLYQEVNAMLYTIAVVMLILWILGLITSNTMGGFLHILLIIAIVMILLRVISG